MSEWITLTSSSDPVSPARYAGALDQIYGWRGCNGLPPLRGEDLAECEREVVAAVRSVEYFEKCAPFIVTPKKARAAYEAAAKKQRKAARSLSGGHRRLLEEGTAGVGYARRRKAAAHLSKKTSRLFSRSAIDAFRGRQRPRADCEWPVGNIVRYPGRQRDCVYTDRRLLPVSCFREKIVTLQLSTFATQSRQKRPRSTSGQTGPISGCGSGSALGLRRLLGGLTGLDRSGESNNKRPLF